ncbi:tryptophan 2,3-dioxygenase [Sphingomonas koreensis]|jgi:tryptophan 2,3-dioxygenase|uniref:Tryptophan 2,3-dioxygenase n=1 Tax=Sphingomonas koreensis TaxID=93064 RepID=A0A1L6J968_9SPHN|nr:tryptophan 2,3-dioxygenase [Sphingomonas koreensis]APR52424.1 tryptophan 2,3-dioxygenase [Sphingomonas koreensis]MDC7811584.1 tryptophan 2,3-dioxygenase [Sphingomonas koreensis]PJI88111.1 tryptophan 2,3-dioxygenase [Sphingomonas koreensis]RSU19689.1 tryptophan 2,3-dioxygenase [Sphingomonas koreensis]RSU26477.1 tryptophan 2,3-dioxygenase [Sphingomonas koreensis]
MSDDMTYGRYLALDQLLSAQHPISDEHDELLFVIIHQTKELWLKQAIAELRVALDLVRNDKLVEAYKSLARVSRIQAVMTLSWEVLTTMTPSDYSAFRSVLGGSSGFQSDQFRAVETLLGLRGGGVPGPLTTEFAALPSLWDEANAALARADFDLPETALNRDWSKPYQPSPEVEAAWVQVYRDPHRWWELYQLAEKLVDIDDALATWRHKHVLTVSRVIGMKPGTGGTPGVPYLQSTVAKRAFPELWSLRTLL